MNILSDFIIRVNAQFPDSIENEELNALLTTIKNQGEEIEDLEKELEKQKKKASKVTTAKVEPKKKAVTKKTPATKKTEA